jgi:polysaccharide export outer membrane protein
MTGCLHLSKLAILRFGGLSAATLIATALIGGCAGNSQVQSEPGVSFEEFQTQYSQDTELDALNQRILSMAVDTGSTAGVYRVGIGDEISVDVFGVEELSGTYRIDGMGRASLPLIGSVELSGYTVSEVEAALEARYGENYLQDPQISVSVAEFRSQQFTAVGAVRNPTVYNTQRKITLVEALAMAGGLSSNAGNTIQLTDRVRNPETEELGTRNLIIEVEDLTRANFEYNVVLGESAVINVPAAGSIFVEGAVRNPGVYSARGNTTVLKAITMAGGLRFEAKESALRVLRREPGTDQWMQQYVAMDEIRTSPLQDLELGDGDIVMVEKGAIKTAWVGFWRGLSGLVFLGFRPFGVR